MDIPYASHSSLSNDRSAKQTPDKSGLDVGQIAAGGLDQAKSAARHVEAMITAHPLVCLGAAAVVGVVIGILVKRQ